MADLRSALGNAGLVSIRQLRESEAEAQLREEMQAAANAKSTNEREKRLGILRTTSSPDTFRKEARKLLLRHPELVQELLNIAHAQGMQKKRDKGGTRLIANLYQVKEALSQNGLSDEARQALVDKLFSKS